MEATPETVGARDGITVRRALAADLDAIGALERLVFDGQAYTPTDLWAFHTRFGELMLVACERDGAIVGYAVGGGRANPDHGITDTGWVNSLAVHPAWRGRGIAGALLDALLAAFVAGGLRAAMLYTEKARAPAIRLYRSRGFTPTRDPHPSGKARVTLAVPLV